MPNWMQCSYLDWRNSLECTIVLKETAEYLGAHGLWHNEMWLWWQGTVLESRSMMWKHHPNLRKILHVTNIISLMKPDPSEQLSTCTRENLLNSLAVPLGFTLISKIHIIAYFITDSDKTFIQVQAKYCLWNFTNH